MENQINYPEIPYQYSLCLNHPCEKASTCLRQLAEQSMPDNIPHWNIISPKHLATIEGDCPYYRPCTKVRFAHGFINMLESIPTKQMREVAPHLIAAFSRRNYYHIRKGERPLSPDEQQTIIKILKLHGVAAPQEFDKYSEEYDW